MFLTKVLNGDVGSKVGVLIVVWFMSQSSVEPPGVIAIISRETSEVQRIRVVFQRDTGTKHW